MKIFLAAIACLATMAISPDAQAVAITHDMSKALNAEVVSENEQEDRFYDVAARDGLATSLLAYGGTS